MSSIHGDFRYALTGDVSFKDNLIRLTLTVAALMGFNHHEMGVNYDDLPIANYYDKTLTVTYPLTVDSSGKLHATPTDNLVDNSAPWNFHAGGILGAFGAEDDLKNGLAQFENTLGSAWDEAFRGYEDDILDMINNSHSWVFPGGKAFAFKEVAFSDSQDLTTHVTYVNPS
jgi:hypothetical protein